MGFCCHGGPSFLFTHSEVLGCHIFIYITGSDNMWFITYCGSQFHYLQKQAVKDEELGRETCSLDFL